MYNSTKYNLNTGTEVSYFLYDLAYTFHSNSTASSALITSGNGTWEELSDERSYLQHYQDVIAVEDLHSRNTRSETFHFDMGHD